jgi:hypothetical protein
VIDVIVGVLGTAKVTPLAYADPGPAPTELSARNSTLYVLPLESPVMTNGDVVPLTVVHAPKLLVLAPTLVAY